MNFVCAGGNRIGSEAHRYLTEGERFGRVVSTFRHGVNVVFGPARDPALVAIQTPGYPLHPWAVELGNAPLFRPGTGCHVVDSMLHLEPGEILSLRALEVDALNVASWSRRRACDALTLVPELQDFLDNFPASWSDLSRAERSALTHQLLPGTEFGWHVLQAFIGRGGGSTPSGDDYTVGHLAVLWALASLSEHARLQIRGVRTLCRWEKLKERTPLGSAQMILAAANGHFPSTVCRLMRELRRFSNARTSFMLRTLASQGATSGVAALTGIVDGLRRAALWYVIDT